MRIPAIPPTVPDDIEFPTFDMRYERKLIQDTKHAYHTIDKIVLDNGKRISINTQYIGDGKLTKLIALYDKFDNWIKSILHYYGRNNSKKTYTSYNRNI